MAADPYRVLGVSSGASDAEIKAAYRALVKLHHPDAGGLDGDRLIVALNAAWEVLGDAESRRRYDASRPRQVAATKVRSSSVGPSADAELEQWLQQIYVPLDRLLGQVIDPFDQQLAALSADPYDDELMQAFEAYLSRSRGRLERAETLFRSRACPATARGFGLSVYHCLSGVQDAVAELQRYTAGYVDGYLHDGSEMIREAAQRRQQLHHQQPENSSS
jgi:molecular chaperone DnaJ